MFFAKGLNAMIELHREITGLVSIDEMAKSLLHGESGKQSLVTIVSYGIPFQVAVTALQREDGSGKSWIFHGYVRDKGFVHGYFRSDYTDGYIVFDSKEIPLAA